MTDTGSTRPRRALGPLPDDEDVAVPRGGSRGMPFDPDWTPPDTETQVLRRVMPGPAAASPGSPDGPDNSWPRHDEPSPSTPASPSRDRTWSPTPVPPPKPAPPKPVLPPSTADLQASAGRRFSASTEPFEFEPAAPRRSATSVSSPPMLDFERPDRPADPGSGSPAEPTSPAAEDADQQPVRRRSRGRALAVMAAVVVMAGGVAGSVYWLEPQAGPPAGPTASPTPSASLDPLLTPSDLAPLGVGLWSTASGATSNPVCLTSDDAMPEPSRTARRVLKADRDADTTVTHVVETYADPTAARVAYNARLQQAGNCPDTEALIVETDTVSGLADAAFATQVEIQASTPEYHALVVSQTGRNLSMIDLTSPKPTALADAAEVAAEPLARLCSGGEGTCPATVALAASDPAPGQFPGWLTKADLPRITPGAGRWGATRPSDALTILGSQCGAINLRKVSEATGAAQRTLLLADDPAAPSAFGIDQVVYTFASGKEAKTFGDKLTSNLADCADRVPTASVKKGPSTKGEAAEGVAFTGRSFLIKQKTAEDVEVPFRVAVVRVGDHVAYLLANPSADFDFTSDQWKAIMTRTAQRVSQLP